MFFNIQYPTFIINFMTRIINKTIIIISILFFAFSGGWAFQYFNFNSAVADQLHLDEQEATIRAIKKVAPAVVSIIVRDEQDVVALSPDGAEQTTEKGNVGEGTGFLFSADGYILTNKHVVEAGNKETAEYQIILNSGKKYFAQFIGIDPAKDLAVLRIFDKNLPSVELGDSNNLEQGMSVIAIGNSLGKYQNSVTKGIVSALGRSIVASDQKGDRKALDNVIQTDAEINQGNSGGPLIDLKGKVVGISAAVDLSGSAIGFAIPINDAKIIIKSIRENNMIVRPMLGVRYRMITSALAEEHNLARDNGALIVPGENGEPAVLPGSAAAQAGFKEGDIIFEINAIKVKEEDSLFSIVQQYKPGDRIGFKVQREDKILILIATLEEYKL